MLTSHPLARPVDGGAARQVARHSPLALSPLAPHTAYIASPLSHSRDQQPHSHHFPAHSYPLQAKYELGGPLQQQQAQYAQSEQQLAQHLRQQQQLQHFALAQQQQQQTQQHTRHSRSGVKQQPQQQSPPRPPQHSHTARTYDSSFATFASHSNASFVSPNAPRRSGGVVNTESATATPRNGFSYSQQGAYTAAASVQLQQQQQQAQHMQQLAQLAAFHSAQPSESRQATLSTLSPLSTHHTHSHSHSHSHLPLAPGTFSPEPHSLGSAASGHLDLLALLTQQQQQQSQPAVNGTGSARKRARSSAIATASSPTPLAMWQPPHALSPLRPLVRPQQLQHDGVLSLSSSPLLSPIPSHPPPPPPPHSHSATHSAHRSYARAELISPQPRHALLAVTAASVSHTRQAHHLGPTLFALGPVTPLAPHSSAAAATAASLHSPLPAHARVSPSAARTAPASHSHGKRYSLPSAADSTAHSIAASNLNSSSSHLLTAALTANSLSRQPVVPLAPPFPLATLAHHSLPLASVSPLGPPPPVAPLGPPLPLSHSSSVPPVVPLSPAPVIPVAPVRPLSPPPPPLLLFRSRPAARQHLLPARLGCGVTASQLTRYLLIDARLDDSGSDDDEGAKVRSSSLDERSGIGRLHSSIWCPTQSSVERRAHSASALRSMRHPPLPSEPRVAPAAHTATCGCSSASAGAAPTATSASARSCDSLLLRPSTRLCAALLSLYSDASALPAATQRSAPAGKWQKVLTNATSVLATDQQALTPR